MDDRPTAQTPQSPVFLFEGLNVLPSFEEDILHRSLETASDLSSRPPSQNGVSHLANVPSNMQPKFQPKNTKPESSSKKRVQGTKRSSGTTTVKSLPISPARPSIMAIMNGDPRPIRLTLESAPAGTQTPAQPAVVFPSSPATRGPVAYFIRPAQADGNHTMWPSSTVLKPLTTQDTIPMHHTIDTGIRPVVNIVRPTVVGGCVSLPVNGSPIPTSVLRPVMTTSIVSSTPTIKRQPILLPKPSVPGGSLSFQNASSSITAGSNFGQSSISTVGGPIRLTKEGSNYVCNQPLSHSQVTEIARAMKGSSGEDVSSIVYEDVNTHKRVVYKIVYPEDVRDEDPESVTGSDDENDCDNSNFSISDIVFTPEEALKIPLADPSRHNRHDKNGKLIAKKRGRPCADDVGETSKQSAANHVKKLRNEFGFTGAQVLNLKQDIGDDSVSVDRAKSSQSDESYFLPLSQTRSGRVTKLPQVLNKSDLPLRVCPRPPAAEVEAPGVEQRPKRRLCVPPRFKCRVCNKVYLGDRKMSRHEKLFPGHGPSHDPNMGGNVNQQLSALSVVPIIPIARTQLEDLVKNLDAELVLDVVSKKMFDNFSMWQLHLKKMIVGKEKGLKAVDRLFQDVETVLTEVKKLVDNCLTDTKLCDEPCPSVNMGEYLQLALSGHDGPWYLEKSNHIPEEFHKQLGIEPIIVSPRSDSNVTSDLHHDDDNSNSMMSAASDREGCPKMVLKMEQNLGTRRRLDDIDDDSQDFGSSLKKFSDANQIMSPEIHDSDDDSHKDAPENLDICKDNQKSPSPGTDLVSLNNMVISKLNEIQESGVPSPKQLEIERKESKEVGSPSSELFPRTPLPSFSSIICTTESSLSVLTPSMTIRTSASDGDIWMDEVNDHLELENDRTDENHIKALPPGKVEKDQRDSVANSRRSSVDTGTLIIHESLPGSSQPSPTMSRRTSVDHGAILHHGNVDQALHSSSSLNLLTSENGSQMKISDNMSLPFLSDIDDGQSCPLSGSNPPHTTNNGEPLNTILGQTIIPRHYRGVPRAPHIQQNIIPTTEVSPIDSLTSFVTKASDERKQGVNEISHCGPMTSSSSSMTIKLSQTQGVFCDNRPSDSCRKPNMDSPKLVSCNIQLPPSGMSQDSSSSASHFLSDLESVLAADSTDFSSFAASLKTPEKVFHHMPQQISNQSRKSGTLQTPPPVRDPLLSSSVRTDFLGAIDTSDLEPRGDGTDTTFQSSLDRGGFGDSLFDTSSNSLSSLFNTKEDPSVDP